MYHAAPAGGEALASASVPRNRLMRFVRDRQVASLAEARAFAADKPARLPDEDLYVYWRRIGGRFIDGWYDAARERGPRFR